MSIFQPMKRTHEHNHNINLFFEESLHIIHI